MSTECRFSLITVKELLHQCQSGVGRWSIMGKNLVIVVKERPPKDIIQCTFLTWVATVSLLRSPPLLDLCSSDDSIAAARSRLARLLWHLSAKRVVTTRDIMSKSPTATTMAIRYSVRNRSSNTSCKYKKIIPIKTPSLYSVLKNMFDIFFLWKQLLWHWGAKRVVNTRDIMSKSPTATTMGIRYSVRNCSSNTSCKYKKIIPIKIPMYSQIWPPGGLFSRPLGMGSHVIWSYWEWHIIQMTKELSPWRI